MIRNYFIIAFRNIRKNLSFSLLNLFGLTLGIISCLIIFLIVKNELTYDNFHKKADRIYRVTLRGVSDYNSRTSVAVVPALRNDFPELEEVCQVWQQESGLVKIGQKLFDEKLYAFADDHFSNVFDYEWIAGDSKTALSEPNSVVLTESIARKYFGEKNPMGQTVILDKEYHLKVTGLIKDVPGNTHLTFNFLVSFETIKPKLKEALHDFYNIAGATAYIVLPKNYAPRRIEARLPLFVAKNWGKEIAKESFLILQPLKDIHFDQRYQNDSAAPTTSKEIYWALSIVALFIILMACINFINLSTVQAMKRSKEVGIRKVLGGNRRELIIQFMSETTLLVLFALALALLGSHWIVPQVGQWLDIKIDINQLKDPIVATWIAAITILVILLAGLYPAFVQSSFNPINSLKNKINVSYKGLTLRRSLVLIQFVITQILIVSTLIVAHQMNFFQNKDLGFNKEAVISLIIPDLTKRELLRQQLRNDPGVKEFSYSSGDPAYPNMFTPFHSEELGILKDDVSEIKSIDDQYLKMFEIKLLAGREIDKLDESTLNEKDTTNPILVNEELVHKLGIQDLQKALGKRVTIYWNHKSTIMGVVKDFQTESKHKKIRPCILFYFPNLFYMACVKLQPKGIHQTIERINKNWSKLFPNDLFKYAFVDDHIASQYLQEEREYTAFKLFSSIAILIGCLGLYGLVAFAAVQKTKEIGIRKVLGASIPAIIQLLSKNFFTLAILASFIAFPIAWYIMNQWLQNFAYHINISWWTFLIATTSSLLITLVTISHQAIKAAIANPVKSLRTE